MSNGEARQQVGGYFQRRRRRKWSRPIGWQITPMIDVVFLLLVYFMLVSQFGVNEQVLGMGIRDTDAARGALDLPRPIVEITMRSVSGAPDGYELVCAEVDAGRAATVERIGDALRDKGGLTRVVVLRPEAGTVWEHALAAYDGLRREGFNKTSLDAGKP